MRIAQRSGYAIDGDRGRLPIDALEQPALLQLVFRVALDGLALELELHDGTRLLHARHLKGLAQSGPFRNEATRWIVGINRPDQMLERLQTDAVALFQLAE